MKAERNIRVTRKQRIECMFRTFMVKEGWWLGVELMS